MEKFLSEDDVKKKLKVEDLNQLTKAKTRDLVAMLPEMKPEVAIKMIEQFPEFSKQASTMVSYLKETVNHVLKDNKDCNDQVFIAYQRLLNDFSEQLKKPFISAKEKRQIAELMIEVADRIAKKDTENKNFLGKMVAGVGTVVLGVITVVGIVLFKRKG